MLNIQKPYFVSREDIKFKKEDAMEELVLDIFTSVNYHFSFSLKVKA
jgi:hypothetical protein